VEALLHGGGVGGVVGCTHFQLYGQLQMYRVEIERRGADSLTKLGAKRAELVQKFVPRSRVGIFRNERTRSTPLTLN